MGSLVNQTFDWGRGRSASYPSLLIIFVHEVVDTALDSFGEEGNAVETLK